MRQIIHRRLCPVPVQDKYGRLTPYATHYTFWGLRRLITGGWRFGFGIGFIEWGKNTCPGIWLPRKETSCSTL